jgi:hypothetical protein
MSRVSPSWRRDAKVVALTEAILERDREARLDAVNRALTLGKLLLQVRGRLAHGQWTVWLNEAVPYTARTAQMYMELEGWREEHPEDFMRFRHLGPTKLHLLLRAPAKVRTQLRRRVRLRLPGTDVLKPIDLMTVKELDAAIRDLAPTPPPAEPIAKVVAAFENRLAQLEEQRARARARARSRLRKKTPRFSATLSTAPSPLEPPQVSRGLEKKGHSTK